MKRLITLAIPLVAVAVIAAGCGGGGSGGGSGSAYGGTPKPTASKTAGGAALALRTTALGPTLVDSQGRTLYLFEKDKNRHSACYGACAQYWPPLLTHGKPVARVGVKQSLLGTTRRRNGSQQVTYAGHPLYSYIGDSKPGQTNGEGSQEFGGGWDALSPTGKKIEREGRAG